MERALILSGGGTRGAFQVGVLQYLEEIGWKPELICGASAGAINAAAIGSGLSHQQLSQLWQSSQRHAMYKVTLNQILFSLFSRRKFRPLFDTSPMKTTLAKFIDIEALRKSPIEILISASHVQTSEITYFNHRIITIEHIMASAAIPGLFPWQILDGKPYWDSGMAENVPMMPAIERGAKSIIVVLLSPAAAIRQAIPRTQLELGELVFEHVLSGSYNVLMANPIWQQNRTIHLVAPIRRMGFLSILNFTPRHVKRLIEEGYIEAQKQLGT